MPTELFATTYDAAAHEIGELQRKAGLHFVVDLGEILIRHFFGGSLATLRHRGDKRQSLRKLAARPDIELNLTALSRAVATYEIVQRLGGVSLMKHLKATHFVQVHALPEPDQDRLLRRADDERWTVERLRQEVARLRPSKEPRQRPRTHPVVATVKTIDKALDALAALEEVPELGELDVQVLRDTEEQLAEAEQRLSALLRTVRDALVVEPPDVPAVPSGPPRPGNLDLPRRPSGPGLRDRLRRPKVGGA